MAVVRSVGQGGGGDQGELRRFRGGVYDCFERRADALFDLVDGICAPVTAQMTWSPFERTLNVPGR